jgi:hypothetical protein
VRAALAEWLAAGLVLAGCAWAGIAGWRTYQVAILPAARSVPTITPTPFMDPVVAQELGRRQRLVQDHIGAAYALRDTNQRNGAIDEFRKALEIDPGNFDARESLRQMGVAVPDGPVVTATVPRPTPLPTVTPRVQR